MYKQSILLLASFLTGVLGQNTSAKSCKCVPGDDCWPSESAWQGLDEVVGGGLIKSTPIANACYPGQDEDLVDCDYVVNEWPVEAFQRANPLGRVLPYNVTCPPVNYTAGETPGDCILGINPVYAVNATTRAAINATSQFARQHNIRLVVTGTGHDLLGRSDGYGGLEVWLRYYRAGIEFQSTYTSSTHCSSPGWNGSAIRIDGNYEWQDVAKVAAANNVIVTTGGSIGVGAIGGWPSGGGHGPATHAYGFGADQILEAEVLLADGRIVTANACQNSDLYRSLRGGGPGYGITLSSTVKTYPNVDVVTAHHLTIVPPTEASNTSALLESIAFMLQKYPSLIDAGVGGYTYWYNHYPTVVVNNSTSGYTHSFWTIGSGEDVARAALDPVVEELQQQYNSSLLIQDNYVTYPDYWSFYDTEMGLDSPEGNTLIMSSRLIERNQTSNFSAVHSAVETISDALPGQYNSNCVLMVGGGQVAKDAADQFSGLLPAWRRVPYAIVTIRELPLQTTNEERQSIEQDMLAKGAYMKAFAPGTGAYMNEADRNDPDYIEDFYGSLYSTHLATKKKYDPNAHFYCPTCVGAEEFVESPDGPLCTA
ncbi:FAD-binding domain-containing protein [Cryphonectria parasitica EP155]|uniref:FAD-binding domain-containing protein n=1 Tax=Cryphonectria parasitica (strain ATCC 38755 / EP155) TaxID=660469 RepID=A0A9P4Y514_CRYP1|nr:FAD-binding domain-containing protein [Cryphonectria parasitica EP155]KAF3766646.1 FAD-binding domain-containing protein [Cryphonectria parasitica EP155]